MRVYFYFHRTGNSTDDVAFCYLTLIAGTLKATNKKVESPPQSCSMCFNDNGECTQLTVGYVMDKQLGNTGGLGGVYGILYAIGYGEFLLIFICAIRLTSCFV